MTKKVLFIKSATLSDTMTSKDWEMLQKGIASGLDSAVTVEAAIFAELVFFADGNRTTIFHSQKHYDIADFDLVVFRRVGDEMEKAISCAHYLRSKDVPFIDSYLLTQGKGKLAGVFMRTAHDIPVPKTFFATADVFLSAFQHIKPFDYPFILKADNGRKGRDNHLIKDETALQAVLRESKSLEMVAQEFIQNDGDYRLLVLNGKVELVIHRKGAEGSHLNNTSQGGAAKLVGVESLPKGAVSDAIRAAELEKLQVAGADIVIDRRDGGYYFLEVNRAPQLATGAYVEDKIAVYTKMVRAILDTRSMKEKTLIGRVEKIKFPTLGGSILHARVDTGAKTSSLWATNIVETPRGLLVRFASPEHDIYQHEQLFAHYEKVSVSSSMGVVQVRYKIQIPVVIKGRRINAAFTLADRSTQTYPVLLGRSILLHKFVVDVSLGSPLVEEERKRSEELQSLIHEEKI